MLLTENEARKKTCPHLPVDIVSLTANNELLHQRVEHYANCIASNCMMWRWEVIDTGDSLHVAHFEKGPRGFCGLAGKPEVA